jgi:3-phenylpropionate/trans-cinnamate dioxygenase ferredoxin reductase component
MSTLSTQPFVIVGAALAGAKAAEALRDEGFEGPIVLIGAERELPYERPPLSKSYLRGEAPRSDARVHDESWYGDHEVELRTGTVVEAIEPRKREVSLAGGERLGFERLLLATGAEPRRLELGDPELARVHYLRDLADADALRTTLGRGGRLVVLGAGWIGMEVAASARQLGLEVTIVEPGAAPLERVLGVDLGGFYAGVHRAYGVEILTGAKPVGLEGSDAVERVVLQDGRRLDCDAVVVGVGVVPRTELAKRAGLLVDNGVVVSDKLQTSVPAIYATGDVASAFHPFYKRHMRVEHWANALNQPATAARAMLGKPASYDRHPYFFSDQYDVGMEFTGDPAGTDEVVIRGDMGSREFIAFWLRGGQVRAGMNVNVWDVTEEIKKLIDLGAPVDKRLLVDRDTELGEVCERHECLTDPRCPTRSASNSVASDRSPSCFAPSAT